MMGALLTPAASSEMVHTSHWAPLGAERQQSMPAYPKPLPPHSLFTDEIPRHPQIGQDVKFGFNVILSGTIKIGDRCRIGNNVVIRSAEIGPDCVIEDNAIIGYQTLTGPFYDQGSLDQEEERRVVMGHDVLVRTGCVVYQDTEIGPHSWLNHGVVLREKCRMGHHALLGSYTVVDDQVTIGNRSVLHNHVMVSGETLIEDCVFVGPNVTFTGNNPIGHLRGLSNARRSPRLRFGCAIGGGATLGPDVEIGQEAQVAAGAMVVKDVEPFTIVAGVPAKKLKDIDPQSRIEPQYREESGLE